MRQEGFSIAVLLLSLNEADNYELEIWSGIAHARRDVFVIQIFKAFKVRGPVPLAEEEIEAIVSVRDTLIAANRVYRKFKIHTPVPVEKGKFVIVPDPDCKAIEV